MKPNIATYKPEVPPVTLDIVGFWMGPDPDRPGMNLIIPIPDGEFSDILRKMDD